MYLPAIKGKTIMDKDGIITPNKDSYTIKPKIHQLNTLAL